MHFFLQICGVVGFGLLGLQYVGFLEVRAGNARVTLPIALTTALPFALISTYFIFG